LVGIHPYRVVSGIKDARVGLQKPLFGGSHAWVLPNPSGLNAHYQAAALAQLFGDLRIWAIAEHGRRHLCAQARSLPGDCQGDDGVLTKGGLSPYSPIGR